ncbi:PREDICTED: ras protein let-60-like, partial [Rhagoletis zephyria]|uniref:ras protein let-60-like n=1 Tax=Rhagoletis zephyria TaxID=28612 RepID=UPI0008119DE9
KTSIVRRLLSEEHFVENHIPTVEELYQLEYKSRGSDVTLVLDLLDTSGSYPFPAMRELAIRSADAFLLVYAVDDADSYEEVIRLKEHIYALRGETGVPPVVVVANKTDLVGSRVIDTNLVDSVVSIDWEFGHVCCSAKANENVSRIFTQLVRQKIQLERLELERGVAVGGNFPDNESDGGNSVEAEVSPLSRASISSSERLFFGGSLEEPPHHHHHFGSFSFGSNHSLESNSVDSRKSSITDSELEFRLKQGFKNGSNCIIS